MMQRKHKISLFLSINHLNSSLVLHSIKTDFFFLFLELMCRLRNYRGIEDKQLVALNVLQELVVQMEEPGCECLLFVHLNSHTFFHFSCGLTVPR